MPQKLSTSGYIFATMNAMPMPITKNAGNDADGEGNSEHATPPTDIRHAPQSITFFAPTFCASAAEGYKKAKEPAASAAMSISPAVESPSTLTLYIDMKVSTALTAMK